MADKWDHRYLEMAKEVAGWSKDPSSKIGAVAVDDKRRILSTGYNGFPRGIADYVTRWQTREIKYKYIVHAEQNMIYNATYNGVSLDGATLYVWGLPICSECAKGIIQVGIKRVVMPLNKDIPAKWRESFLMTQQMFDECGIQFEFVDISAV